VFLFSLIEGEKTACNPFNCAVSERMKKEGAKGGGKRHSLSVKNEEGTGD